MKKSITIFIALVCVLMASFVWAQDKATPEDVYKMVIKAHDVLKNLGEAGLVAFNDPKGEFVFKDSYVFVLECPKYVVAHPFALDKLKGIDQREITSFHTPLCQGAQNPNGQWVEYEWPKPGEKDPSRKIAFIINVKGTPYQVVAGIYNDTTKLEDLNKSLK